MEYSFKKYNKWNRIRIQFCFLTSLDYNMHWWHVEKHPKSRAVQKPSHLVHLFHLLISSHLISCCLSLVESHLIWSHLIFAHLIWPKLQFISSHLVSSHLEFPLTSPENWRSFSSNHWKNLSSSHLIPSHLILPHLISSHPDHLISSRSSLNSSGFQDVFFFIYR